MFPADNAWNQDISNAPVDPNSAMYINAMGPTEPLHPDFGSDPTYGIPFNLVHNSTPTFTVPFYYADESDPGPYPIASSPLIEYGNDHHILSLNTDTCVLYELYHAARSGTGWTADSGAVWNMNIDATRPAGWTSADEAGLPILPGLTRYDEVAAGAINHALRFTVAASQHAYVAPASHLGSYGDTTLPPMGLRVRLKANFDISSYPASVQVILRALKRYGMIVADDGGAWFLSGTQDSRWNQEELYTMMNVHGSDFEVVQLGTIHTQ